MIPDVDVLVCDVFGTVVDWRGSIIAEGESVWADRGLQIDWNAFAVAWRAGYQPAMDRIRRGNAPWATIDTLHRSILDRLLPKFGIHSLNDAQQDELNRVWHRLSPWPDSVAGIARLRERYTVTTLSNGNMSLLVELSKRSGLQWDCVLSSELAGHYKPDLETYQMACDLLDVPPARALMVAAHAGDLVAARKIGMKTAFIHRPLENAPGTLLEQPDDEVDILADDLLDLAAKLAGE